MPVDLNSTNYATLEGRIDYSSGNSIFWKLCKTNNGRIGAVFAYKTPHQIICFNDILPVGWIFEAVNNKFRAHILCTYGNLPDYPEVHICIPKLKENENDILSILHEIGHAWDMTRLHSELLDITLDGSLGKPVCEQYFTTNYPFVCRKEFTRYVNNEWTRLYGGEFCGTSSEGEIISERNAWALALRFKRRLNILPELKGEQLHNYYQRFLESHYEHALEGMKTNFAVVARTQQIIRTRNTRSTQKPKLSKNTYRKKQFSEDPYLDGIIQRAKNLELDCG